MKNELLLEYGMEIAIEKIAPIISEKIKEYKKTRKEETRYEIAELLKDREKIYSNDINTIKKYCQEK